MHVVFKSLVRKKLVFHTLWSYMGIYIVYLKFRIIRSILEVPLAFARGMYGLKVLAEMWKNKAAKEQKR